MSMETRYVLVTGGSRGIGRGIALKLARLQVARRMLRAEIRWMAGSHDALIVRRTRLLDVSRRSRNATQAWRRRKPARPQSRRAGTFHELSRSRFTAATVTPRGWGKASRCHPQESARLGFGYA